MAQHWKRERIETLEASIHSLRHQLQCATRTGNYHAVMLQIQALADHIKELQAKLDAKLASLNELESSKQALMREAALAKCELQLIRTAKDDNEARLCKSKAIELVGYLPSE